MRANVREMKTKNHALKTGSPTVKTKNPADRTEKLVLLIQHQPFRHVDAMCCQRTKAVSQTPVISSTHEDARTVRCAQICVPKVETDKACTEDLQPYSAILKPYSETQIPADGQANPVLLIQHQPHRHVDATDAGA